MPGYYEQYSLLIRNFLTPRKEVVNVITLAFFVTFMVSLTTDCTVEYIIGGNMQRNKELIESASFFDKPCLARHWYYLSVVREMRLPIMLAITSMLVIVASAYSLLSDTGYFLFVLVIFGCALGLRHHLMNHNHMLQSQLSRPVGFWHQLLGTNPYNY